MSGIAGKYAKLALYAPGPIAKRKRRERDDAVQKTRQENWVKKFIAGGGDFMKAAGEYRKHLEEMKKVRQSNYKKWKKAQHQYQQEKHRQKRLAKKTRPVQNSEVPKPERPPQRLHYRKGMSSADFYRCWEWNTLRYQTLKRFGAVCMHCGAPGNHVDHIKPRSRYPGLELDPENLQILCEPCNVGKSNLYEDDWRKDGPSSSPA